MKPIRQREILHIKQIVDIRVGIDFHVFTETERFVNPQVCIEEAIASFSDVTCSVNDEATAQAVNSRLGASTRV